MDKKVVLKLSELKSMLNSIINQIEEENAKEGKEMVSMLMSCDFVNVYDLLVGETIAFLEYMESCGFIRTEMKKININRNHSYVQSERVSIHEWVKFVKGKGCLCHPALIALYKIYAEKC